MFNSLTEEQLSIQHNCAAIATVPSMRMRIIARAGTGKTTTMEAVVMKIKQEDGPQPLICYTAFNKTTETEFGERIRKKILAYSLPFKDIESRTLHSLCYNWFIGTRGGEFLRDMKENIDTEPVVKYFNLENLIGERYGAAPVNVYTPVTNTAANRSLGRRKEQRVKYEAIWVGELILKTLENFLNSSASEITDKHLPYQITHRFKEWCDKIDLYLIKHHCLKISAAEFYGKFDFTNRAAALYKESLSHNEAAGLNVTHSVYQKYTQLSGAVLTSKQGKAFNVYLVDEAQDLNECQCAIIHRQYQNGATIALVGDPAQSIYQFRGACRQFERWEVDTEETLTMSFRFGRQVARLCNIMLGMEKLWLHSLRDALNPNSLPLGLKREIKAEGAQGATQYPSNTQGNMQHPTQLSTQGTPNTPLTQTASSQQPSGPTMIQALVRGLAEVADKWVAPETTLDYPFTVICRTNNNTYFALLECIQVAVMQTRKASVGTGPSTGGVTVESNPNHNTPFTNGTANASTQSQRKRPWEETYTPNHAHYDTNPNAPYMHHTNTTNTTNYPSAPYTNTTTPGLPVQVLPQCPTEIITAPRRFYVNGVKSYAQLENNLVRRIEQLAQISLTKPYMYKGEQYTDIEALRDVSTEMEDITLRELIDITKKWGGDIDNIKNLIRTHYAAHPAEADVFVTTVHKSKGLEWDNVALGIDLGSPLQAQPLFVIECGGSDDGSGNGSANSNDTPSGERKYAICLEKTREDAFEAINLWLMVGRAGVGGGLAAGANAVANAASSVPVKVKSEPGMGHTQNVNTGNGSGVIDLCEDEEWTCSKCSHTNPEYEKSCDNCFVPRHPVARTAAHSTLSSTSKTVSSAKKVSSFAADAADYGIDGYDTAPDESPPQNGAEVGSITNNNNSSSGVAIAPHRNNRLVSLLPSTVALGYQMLRNPAGGAGGGSSSSTGAGGNGAPVSATSSSKSKCQLICLYATHIACRARVLCMFQHEVGQRKRQHGAANVCVIVRNGEGAMNYRLDYSNTGTNDETAQVMQQFQQQGGRMPQGPGTQPSTLGTQANFGTPYIKPEHPLDTPAPPTTTPEAVIPRFDPFTIKFSNRQNANEWYVAVSRAKRTLRANKELHEVLEWVQRDIGGLRTVLRSVIGDEAEVIENK